MQYNPQSNYGYTNSPSASQSFSGSQTMSQSYANASVDSLTTGTTNGINYLLKNNYVRVFVFVVATVYAGYTLMPVPSNFKKMLDKSYLMKYLILFFVAASMLHPLDNEKLKICVVVPIFVLIMFRMMRNRSKGKSLFHGIGRAGDDCSDSESRYSSRSSRSSRRSEDRHSAAGMVAAGAVGVGVGAHMQGKKDKKHKKDKKSKKSKKSKKDRKHNGKGKKGSKRSSSSDSVKGMEKFEHFAFV